MATKKKRRSQEPWPGFDDGLDAAPSGEYVTPGGGRYERIVPPMLTGAAAARAKRLLGVCELEGNCQKVAGHDGPCTRRNPHEQYYGDEDPEDAEYGGMYQEAYHLAGFTEAQQQRIYEGVMPRLRRNPRGPSRMRRNEGTKTEAKQRKRELPIDLLYGDGASGPGTWGSSGNRKIVAVTAAGVAFVRTYGEYHQSSNGTEFAWFDDYESALDHVKIAVAMGVGAKKIPASEIQHMVLFNPGHGGGDGGESRYNPRRRS